MLFFLKNILYIPPEPKYINTGRNGETADHPFNAGICREKGNHLRFAPLNVFYDLESIMQTIMRKRT